MARRTQDEIAAEIAALQALLTSGKVPQYTAFGDSNHQLLEEQIYVLKMNLDEDDIYGTWGDESDDEDEYILNGALEAQAWRDGESDDRPSLGWA